MFGQIQELVIDFIENNNVGGINAEVDMSWEDIGGVQRTQTGVTTLAIRGDLAAELFSEEDVAAMVDNSVTTGLLVRTKWQGITNPCLVINTTALDLLTDKETREAATEHKQQRENRELKRQLKSVQSALNDNDIEATVASMVTGKVKAMLQQKQAAVASRELNSSKAPVAQARSVPTLFLSDLHWDECVAGDEVEYMNEYNRSIATDRLNRVFDNAANLLFDHTAGVTHEELVLVLGGDMVSGDIHGELARTNEGYTPETVMDLAGKLAANIRGMAKEFPSVYIPCVSGNHGRLTMKPTAKGRMTNSFDWLVYKVVEAMTADIPNVLFDISRSADMTYKVYDWKYRLTHGDQFKGGSGVGGIFPSLLRTDMRKHKREATLRRDPYQYLIMGHFHRYSVQDGILINGTLKGVDEYSYVSNFDVQAPCQALWLTHPEYGMTVQMPVFCDKPTAAVRNNAPPVTPSVALSQSVASALAETRTGRVLRKNVA